MINKDQLKDSLLSLAFTNPTNFVDIEPLVVKFCEELDFGTQVKVRGTIIEAITELQKEGKIQFHSEVLSLSASRGRKFFHSNGRIRSILSVPPPPVAHGSLHGEIESTIRSEVLTFFQTHNIKWNGNNNKISMLDTVFNLKSKPSISPSAVNAFDELQGLETSEGSTSLVWPLLHPQINLMQSNDIEFIGFLKSTINSEISRNELETILIKDFYFKILSPIVDRIKKIDTEFWEIISRSGSQGGEIRQALVVGCSSYKYATKLKNPINDANDLSIVLQNLGFRVTKVVDPTLAEIKQKIADFGSQIRDSDVSLFYFAGHGIQINGENFLIPIDANLTSEEIAEYECIHLGRILSQMESHSSCTHIVILDACRNNPFERNWTRGDYARGLATIPAPKGTLISFSTSPGKTASDGSGRNGLFTESLLNNIAHKGKTILSMFQMVRVEVAAKTKNKQIPWETTSLFSDFYFSK